MIYILIIILIIVLVGSYFLIKENENLNNIINTLESTIDTLNKKNDKLRKEIKGKANEQKN